jgi:hypothetical protein
LSVSQSPAACRDTRYGIPLNKASIRQSVFVQLTAIDPINGTANNSSDGTQLPTVNPMIQNITAMLTSTAMLAHALLGCCWHHAHADETNIAGGCSVHVANRAHSNEHGRETQQHHCGADESKRVDPASAGHNPDADDDHRHSVCDEGPCEFVRSSKIKPPLSWSLLTNDSIPLHGRWTFAVLTRRSRPPDPDCLAQCLFQPVQELTQVWLL